MKKQIFSLQNPRIKNAVRLRQSRARKKQQATIIDGIREVRRAVDGDIEMLEVFIHQPHGRMASESLGFILDKLECPVFEVNSPVFEKLSYGDRGNEIVAVAKTPERSLGQLTLGTNPLVLVLDGIEKPGNIGATVRTAVGAGVDAIVLAEPITDLFNPNTIRSSLGSVFVAPIAEAGRKEAIAWLERVTPRIDILSTRIDGDVDYENVDFRKSTCLVLGSESHGLAHRWDRHATKSIRLAMEGIVDSLNVSTTAAVLLYEARRQRRSARRS